MDNLLATTASNRRAWVETTNGASATYGPAGTAARGEGSLAHYGGRVLILNRAYGDRRAREGSFGAGRTTVVRTVASRRWVCGAVADSLWGLVLLTGANACQCRAGASPEHRIAPVTATPHGPTDRWPETDKLKLPQQQQATTGCTDPWPLVVSSADFLSFPVSTDRILQRCFRCECPRFDSGMDGKWEWDIRRYTGLSL